MIVLTWRLSQGEVGDVVYEGCEKLTCIKKKKKLMWISSQAK